jgi:hypothetical protein
MNDEIKHHMDVLFQEVKTWPKELFPQDNPKTDELLLILENFDKIEEDCYETLFEEMMDPVIFNPVVHAGVTMKNIVSMGKFSDLKESYEFMMRLFLELQQGE